MTAADEEYGTKSLSEDSCHTGGQIWSQAFNNDLPYTRIPALVL